MNDNKLDLKSIDVSKLLKTDLKDVLKTDLTQMRTYQPQITTQIPKINVSKQETAKPKTGIEGWYEKHNGKINLGFQIFGAVMTVVAIVEGYVIYLLSK